MTRLQRELSHADLADRVIGSSRDRQGYGIRADRAEVDLLSFRLLTASGSESLRMGRFDSAANAFGEALGLWRGPMGNDLPQTRRLAALADGLRGEHVAATEGLAHATAGAGRYLDAVIQLERLLVDHPTRETCWLLLACAHYLSGNAVAAQATIRRAHNALAQLVGMGGGPALKAAEQAAVQRDGGWFHQRLANLA